jgi:hypothetical protein
MQLRGSSLNDQGLTLIEVVVVLFSLFILAATLLATVSAPRIRNSVGCVNQLKQAGLAASVREGNNHGQPAAILTATNGVAWESGAAGTAEALFQGMSNELAATKLLVCPADMARLPAASFHSIKPDNLSYFINLNHTESNPQSFLLGDDNLEVRGARVKAGVLDVSPRAPLSWTAERHRFYGNIALGDGSVQGINNPGLRQMLRATNFPPLRLAIP